MTHTRSDSQSVHFALVVNPLAGIGGSAALKGSDQRQQIVDALGQGFVATVGERMARFLAAFMEQASSETQALQRTVRWSCWGGAMGADWLTEAGMSGDSLGAATHQFSCQTSDGGALIEINSSADDTAAAVARLCQEKPDLLLFAGGDGTARDVARALSECGTESQPILGIPAGVKMQSSVFARTPERAAEIAFQYVNRPWVSAEHAEVRDIDEAAYQRGEVRSQHYANVLVPAVRGLLQGTKEGGVEREELAVQDIAAELEECLPSDLPWILGAGTTVLAFKERLAMDATLLGVDVFWQGRQLAKDASGPQLLACLAEHEHCALIVSPTGGQGMLLGRGNQQLLPEVLRKVAEQDLFIIATRSKLASLQGATDVSQGLTSIPDGPDGPDSQNSRSILYLDSGEAQIDERLSGARAVLVGFNERVLVRVERA